MDLTIYLLKDLVDSFEAVFAPDLVPPAPIGQGIQDGFEYRAYLFDGEEHPPSWAAFVRGYVDDAVLNAALNRTYSLLILLRIDVQAGARYFAVPFGYARHCINSVMVEPNFGLKTTLNSIDENNVRTVDSKRPGVKTIQRREVSNLASSMSEFTFEFDSEIIRLVEGVCSDLGLGRKIGGADSLHLTTGVDFTELGDRCRTLFDKFCSNDYRNHFEFIDYISPVRDPVMQNQLNLALTGTVNAKYIGPDLAIAYPDQIDYSRFARFRIRGFHRVVDVEDLSLQSVYAYVGDRHVIPDNILETIRISGVNENGNEVAEEPLYSYLAYETHFDENRYVLHDKRWYVLNPNFLGTLREKIEHYLYPYGGPNLQVWRAGVHEGNYNNQYIGLADYLVLDRDNFIAPGTEGHGKVEVADLFHRPSKRLFCVKDLRASSTLSHLFSQGSVSAELFKDWPLYRAEFLRTVNTAFPNSQMTDGDLNDLVFVYAVRLSHGGDALDALPFFSKVNLLRHLKQIRNLGYHVELTGIPAQ